MEDLPATPLIRLCKWDKYYDTPSMGTMRYLALKRKENGMAHCLHMVSGRLYINVQDFWEWMNNHPDGYNPLEKRPGDV